MTKRKSSALAEVVRQLADLNPAPVLDRDLIERFARANDQAAFAALVARHSAMVLGVCRRKFSDRADAEDACQAVFWLLAKKAARASWQPSLANWLYDAARKVCHNARISAARRRTREAAVATRAVTPSADDMTARELLAALDEELGRLAGRYREPLILCYLEGLTRDEAAQRLGVPIATLKGQLERGRKKLADALTRRGCTLGSALALVATSASVAAPNLSESILATVGGSPSEAVAAMAQGVTMNGSLLSTKLALMAAVLAGAVGFGFSMDSPGEPVPPNPPLPKIEAPPKAEAKRDRFDDPLPDGAVMRLGTTRFRVAGLNGLGFRKTGELVALGDDLKLTTWPADRSDKATTRYIFGKPKSGWRWTLSPDARFAAGWREERFVVMDLSGEEAIEVASPEVKQVWLTGFSPNGEWLAVNSDPLANKGGSYLWLLHLPTKKLTTFRPYGMPLAFSFTPDGTRLAALANKELILIDTVKSEELRRLPGAFNTVSLRADGKTFLVSAARLTTNGERVYPSQVYSVGSGEELAKFDLPTKVSYSPGGKTLWGQTLKGMVEYDPTTGKPIREIAGSHGADLVFSPDGRWAASKNSEHSPGAIQLWDLKEGKLLRPEVYEAGHSFPITTVTVSPDGKVIVTEDEFGHFRMWDASTGASVGPVIQAPNDSAGVRFRPDSKSFVVKGNGNRPSVLYDTATGQERRRFHLPKAIESHDVYRLWLSGDGKTLTALTRFDGRKTNPWFVYWDVGSGNVLKEVETDDHTVVQTDFTPRSFSPDGKWLLHWTALRQFRGDRWSEVGKTEAESWANFSADSRFAARTFGTDETRRDRKAGEIHIYDLVARATVQRLPTGLTIRHTLTPDGRRLAVCTYEEIAVWDVPTGKKVWRVTHPFGGAIIRSGPIAFTPDGRRLITADDCTALVWDISSSMPADGAAASSFTPEELAKRYESLAGEDAAVAYRNCWELIDRPAQTVKFLREKLQPVRPADGKTVKKLVGQLDSPAFAEREAAGKELLELGESALPELRSQFEDQLSPEQKTRIETLLKRYEPQNPLPPAILRHARAVMILERIGTPDARKLLEELSGGMPEATLTREAISATERLRFSRAE